MNKTEFLEYLKKINITPNKKQLEQLDHFYHLLIEWNKKINLTRITEEKEVYLKHYYDCLTINRVIDLKKIKSLCDVGTGAGFPGIVIKILFPHIKITLIDSLKKRIDYLNVIIKELELENIVAIHTRAEDYAINYRETYDVAVSRAVANMSTLVEYLIPFVKVNGIVICMKGPNFEEELKSAKKAIQVLGGKIEKIENLYINEELERNIIIIRKVKATPKQYPRNQSKPLKDPIK